MRLIEAWNQCRSNVDPVERAGIQLLRRQLLSTSSALPQKEYRVEQTDLLINEAKAAVDEASTDDEEETDTPVSEDASPATANPKGATETKS